MNDSGTLIREFRKAQKLPLKTLAGDVGVTGATLSRVETGKLGLSLELAKKLSERCGIPMAQLRPDLAPMFQGDPEAAQ
jgi:transcriptional regulator with XRE-family HTH domain